MLPIAFDETHRRFTMAGVFCSWNCCKRYAFEIQQRGDTPPPGISYIPLLAFATSLLCTDDDLAHDTGVCDCPAEGEAIAITKADDRERLASFGGPLSIEKFRESFLTIASPINLSKLLNRISKRRMRGCSITRVAYEGPSQIFSSVVQVLPYSSRAVVAPNAPPPKAPIASKPLRPTTTARRTSNTRRISTSAPSAATTAAAASTVLSVNEEQAFYMRRLSAQGSILDSMGVTVRPYPQAQPQT
jgi:hypothetical protein